MLNFEHFSKPKTIENVTAWMFDSLDQVGIKSGDINQLSADGASNAIGSVAEYESLSRTDRSNDVLITRCLAHQNERSAGYASGTLKFAQPKNEALGAILKKSHKIQVDISHAPTRLSFCLSKRKGSVSRCSSQTHQLKQDGIVVLMKLHGQTSLWGTCAKQCVCSLSKVAMTMTS